MGFDILYFKNLDIKIGKVMKSKVINNLEYIKFGIGQCIYDVITPKDELN